MNAKDLRTEAALGDRSNDGNTKYAQGGGALSCHRNKTYQDIGSNTLAKVDAPPPRPCAVIGPDRVVPPPAPAEYHKKSPLEPWLTPDGAYRRPPEYPHKLMDYQHPSRNISPRQTFQENMQRIMVPPSYNAVKLKEDHNFAGDPNITQMRNNKLHVPTDSNTKYCDVPYTVNPITIDQKNVRNLDVSVSNMNSVLARGAPHGWPPTSSNIQPPKPFHQELCQYPDYQNCAVPRPMVMARPHRPVHEEPGPVYPDAYYQHGNIRFKPYPSVKERYPQTRYEYIGNYSNPFHPPPPFAAHKYDTQKTLPPHPYPNYPQVPLKYLDSRMADPIMNGYQRALNQQPACNNVPYRNQVIHPTYGPVPGNCLPSGKYYSYPPDAAKPMVPNKLPYDANGKLYPDYESSRSKSYPTSDAFYVNEIGRSLPTKGAVLPPNYPTNIHAMPAQSAHPYYRKELLKGYEYSSHFRNADHMLGMNGNLMARFPSQFPSSTIAISPSDSNTSNDTNQTQGTCQEDFGYVSQSSTASVRSMDSVINRMPPDVYRRYDYRYGNIIKESPAFTKHEQSASNNIGSKEKKDIDVRQFLQMWNEGEDEGGENISKEVNNKNAPISGNSISAANYEAVNQEQLYVLGLVNVPSEELSKYEHIQKVSKLPENIKGYNSIELLHQFEEVVESSNLNHYNTRSPTSKQFHDQLKSTVQMHGIGIPSRPISPLDVEAKISQSVIHKEVGCNFEIKPCSPKMLNVEVAAPVQNVTGERMIEKVSNPLINQPQILHNINENRDDCNVPESHLSIHDNTKTTSCKMFSKPYGNKDPVDPVKTNYSIQDLESNSGVCLASLPRLDNDIELNFPEVNQQFINANKVESVITSGPKDLTPLSVDQTQSINCEMETDSMNSSSMQNTEKDFTKLSKYRKLKRKSPGPNTPEANVQAMRTDSVIIKNPENCKHENFERVLSPKAIPKRAQENPINLSVNTEHRHIETQNLDSSNANDVVCNDIAIDFSLNSNEANNNVANINIKTAEVITTNNNHLNYSNVEGQGTNNEVQDHAVTCRKEFIHKGERVTETQENLNSQAACTKESLDVTNTTDNIINLPKSELARDTINKDNLTKKISSYSLLSSQEKEDTLNEKMRELFGEEFSTAEAETNFEQIHDTQAILDDNPVGGLGKGYVFSDESSQSPDKHETCMSEDLGKEIKALSMCNKEPREKNQQNWDVVSKDALLSQSFYEKNDFENSDDESLKNNTVTVAMQDENKIDEQFIFNDINGSLIKLKSEEPIYTRPKTDNLRVSKELLSPWMQKLIVNLEGSYSVVTTDSLKVVNNDDDKNVNADNTLLETVNNYYSCEGADEIACGMLKINDRKEIENVYSNSCSKINIATFEKIEDNKCEIKSNFLKQAYDCENDETLNKTGFDKESKNWNTDLEIKSSNKSYETLKPDNFKFLVANSQENGKSNNEVMDANCYANSCKPKICKVSEMNDNHQIDNSLDDAKSNHNILGADVCDKSLNTEKYQILDTIDNRHIADNPENDKTNNKVMEADCDNRTEIVLKTINGHQTVNSLENTESTIAVVEADYYVYSNKNKTCQILETVNEHQIDNSKGNDSSSNKVMKADVCDNGLKTETCKVLETIDDNQITDSQENEKSNNFGMDAYVHDDRLKTGTSQDLETSNEYQIANSKENDKSNNNVMEADYCDNNLKTETTQVLETIAEHENANSQENYEPNDEVMDTDNYDKRQENETCMVLQTVDKQVIANNQENDRAGSEIMEAKDCDGFCKIEDVINLESLDKKSDFNNKFEHANKTNDLEIVNENIVNDTSNNLKDTINNKDNENMELDVNVMSSSHNNSEERAGDIDNTEAKQQIRSLTNTEILKSTENLRDVSSNTGKKYGVECGEDVENASHFKFDKEKAPTENDNDIFDNDTDNQRINAIDSDENLQNQTAVSNKYLDDLNCQSYSSRWSLTQTPEHMGILSPLTSDTDTNDSGNEYEINFVSDEDNFNGVRPITRKYCFSDRNKKDKQQSEYKSKISTEMMTTFAKDSYREIIPASHKNLTSVHDSEGTKMNMQEEFSIHDLNCTKTAKPITNAATCCSITKSNKNNADFEKNLSNIATSQPINEKHLGENADAGETTKPITNAAACSSITKLNMNNADFENDLIAPSQPINENHLGVNVDYGETECCYKIKTEPVLEASTSCSDVSDETSASDDDNSYESSRSIVTLNNEELEEPISLRAVNKRTETFEKNKFGSVASYDLCLDKPAKYKPPSKNEDSEKQRNYNHNQVLTSEAQNVDVEDEEVYEQNYNMTDIITEPILSDRYAVENTSIPKHGMESKVDTELIDYTVEDLQGTETNFIHVSENVMDDSGIILETTQENTNFEMSLDSTPYDILPNESRNNLGYPTSYLAKRRKSLKRSLSDSALDDIRDNFNDETSENNARLCPNKRKKDSDINNYNTSRFIAENICQVLQSNRRNSISSIHTEGNVSFCILIDNNCIMSEECDDSAKICFSEVPENCLATIQEESLNEGHYTDNINLFERENECEYSTPVETNLYEKDKSMEEPWVDNVACVETVVSDDIGENVVIGASMSLKDDEYNDDETEVYDLNEHTDKLKCIYGDKIYNDDTHFVQTLYRTPQMNVNKTLNHRESSVTDVSQIADCSRYYDKESLERVLSDSINQDKSHPQFVSFPHRISISSPVVSEMDIDINKNPETESCIIRTSESPQFQNVEHPFDNVVHDEKLKKYSNEENNKESIIKSCESSIDDVFNFKKCEESAKCATSSSPEVSSTTSEEKNSGILLKITNYGGSRVSRVNNISPLNRISCKYTENKDYSSSNGNLPTRTLLTKGAQKYIPPLKETIRGLKVKLPLPEQSLLKLKQLKLSKETLKLTVDRPSNTLKKEIPKKIKPKFEDVLKSIDEVQYQRHKENNKKGRKSIPKVVIKKNEHGSHYASTSNKNKFNPDLTGMKWQPWVFLEKDNFIDKMALRKKTQAIFSYRKNTYVLAEKFQKYKSICNTKFVISQPKHKDPTSGQLKYTIRLKHNY